MARCNLLLLGLAALAGSCAAAPQNGKEAPSPAPSVLQAALDEHGAVAATRVARAAPADRWLQLLAEYARGSVDADADADADADGGGGAWFPRPIPVSLPIGRGDGKQSASLPVLILPVPVPAPASARTSGSQCSADHLKSANVNDDDGSYSIQKPFTGHKPGPFRRPAGRTDQDQGKNRDFPSFFNEAASPAPSRDTTRRDRPAAAGSSAVPSQRPFSGRYGEEPSFPQLDYIVNSQQLVELFQAQVAPNPELPPAVIPDYTAGQEPAETFTGDSGEPVSPVRRSPQRIRRFQRATAKFQLGGVPVPPVPPAPFARFETSPSAPQLGSPPTPRFERSLMLRGELTVPRAGYTEPYTVWWDAATGAARLDLHGGATSAYRLLLPDGRMQRVAMRLDRSGEREMRRCTLATPRSPSAEDRALPALPDLQDFSFAGYSDAEYGRVETWKRTVSGRPGEMGGAQGEALTFRHELLLTRAPDNYTTTPLKYSVSVDSSVLGTDCDGYVHRYSELRDQNHDPAMLSLDVDEACEQTETTARRERVEPLREYTLPYRDPRHDSDYQRFKTEHRRQYLDDSEEAVRKNVMVQHSRFVDSGNRQGATFGMEVNHLGDRLDAELSVLRGVREDAEGLPAERFPHSRDQLAAMRHRLPRAFDWRERGAVTHVRNQGSCSSCWAFAVTGAVEGALYIRTRRLVPLSEQCLVDCAHPFGGHGCGGTWPSAAYDYVHERGLPALDEYTPYQGKVLTCVDKHVPPVTHISSHVNVTRNSVQALKVAIRRHAPTVVLIDSSPKSFTFYKTGVVNDERCAKNKAEHAVLAVGWGEQRSEPHFIVKNSWSAAWGDGGYIRLAAAPNTCGVLSRPSYPRLEREDVDRVPADVVAAAADRD